MHRSTPVKERRGFGIEEAAWRTLSARGATHEANLGVVLAFQASVGNALQEGDGHERAACNYHSTVRRGHELVDENECTGHAHSRDKLGSGQLHADMGQVPLCRVQQFLVLASSLDVYHSPLDVINCKQAVGPGSRFAVVRAFFARAHLWPGLWTPSL